jgi:DNA-binding FadR family transcriptional regulator
MAPASVPTAPVVARPKLHTQIAEQLGVQMVAGELRPHQALPPEMELAERYGVSKPVIREAIQLLGSARLIQVRHGKRTTVLPEDEWDVLNPLVFEAFRAAGRSAELLRDLYAVRELLEPPAAGWTAQRATSEQLEVLASLVREIGDAAEAGDQVRLLDADRRFHMAIIETAGSNAVLHAIFRDLQALLARSWALPLGEERLAEIHGQHAEIAEAIAQRNPAEAQERMRDHIRWAASSDLASISD